jgi:hypothetical protein
MSSPRGHCLSLDLFALIRKGDQDDVTDLEALNNDLDGHQQSLDLGELRRFGVGRTPPSSSPLAPIVAA